MQGFNSAILSHFSTTAIFQCIPAPPLVKVKHYTIVPEEAALLESRLSRRLRRKRLNRYRFLAGLAAAGLIFLASPLVASAVVPFPAPRIDRSSAFYDVKGNFIGRLSEVNQQEIPLSQVPATVKEALIATEDASFYSNVGVNLTSIVRAAYTDIRSGSLAQGGSTLTQQLVKNIYLTSEKSFWRKLVEAVLALKLTATYSKDQLLTMYLNTVYFGQGAYGIEAASWTYFGMPARNLTLSQAALLVGLINAPSYYDPYNNQTAAVARRRQVLQRMVDVGTITQARANLAAGAPVNLAGGIAPPTQVAPYFISYCLNQIATRSPSLAQDVSLGGYKIYTTLNLGMQRAADRAMNTDLPYVSTDAKGVPQPEGALVALDPKTGGIVSMVGGANYQATPFNRAMAPRQPGSSFKAFLYTAVLSSGYTAASTQVDKPVHYPAGNKKIWTPHNFGNNYLWRPVTVQEAVQISDNVVAVKWAAKIGLDKLIAYARKMGITSPLAKNLTLALGSSGVTPLEMATGYAPLANGGLRVEPYAVREIVDPYGNVVYRADPPAPVRVISPQVAYIMTSILHTVFLPPGTGAGLGHFPFPVAGKTGTSGDMAATSDGWFVGYSPTVVTATWVGYDDPSQTISGQGATTAGPIWASFMRRAVPMIGSPKAFPRPSGLVNRTICQETGKPAGPNCANPMPMVFLKGTGPGASGIHNFSLNSQPVPSPKIMPLSPKTTPVPEPTPQPVPTTAETGASGSAVKPMNQPEVQVGPSTAPATAVQTGTGVPTVGTGEKP